MRVISWYHYLVISQGSDHKILCFVASHKKRSVFSGQNLLDTFRPLHGVISPQNYTCSAFYITLYRGKSPKKAGAKTVRDFWHKTVQKVKKAKKLQKGLAKRRAVWYYTWAPRAAGKNDFRQAKKQENRTTEKYLKSAKKFPSFRKKSAWQTITNVVK